MWDQDSRPLRLEILDSAGDVIRTLKPSNEVGVQQVMWDFRLEPAFEASNEGGGFRGGPPMGAGPRVLPGTYMARLTVGDESHTREIEVRLDPRRNASRSDLVERQKALMQVYALAQPIRDAAQRLTAMDQRMNEIEKLVATANLEEEDKAQLEGDIEDLSETLEELREDFSEANRMGRQTGSIENWSGRPSADQLWSIDQTWEVMPKVIERINSMLTNRMPAFEALLTNIGVVPSLGEPIPIPRRR